MRKLTPWPIFCRGRIRKGGDDGWIGKLALCIACSHERGVTVLHSHLESGQGRAVTDTCLCIAHHREVIVEGRHVDGDRLEGGVVRDACAGNSRVSKNQCLWGRKEAA